MIREVQRELQGMYSHLSVATLEANPYGSSGMCHWGAAGYQVCADLMTPLVARDNYGLGGTVGFPNVTNAYFTTTNRNQIALVFGQKGHGGGDFGAGFPGGHGVACRGR